MNELAKKYGIPNAREYEEDRSAEFQPEIHAPKPLEIMRVPANEVLFSDDEMVMRARWWYKNTSRAFFAEAERVSVDADQQERQDASARMSVVRAQFTTTEANSVLSVIPDDMPLFPGAIPARYLNDSVTYDLLKDAARATASPDKLAELFVYVPEMKSIELARCTTVKGGKADELQGIVDDMSDGDSPVSTSVKINPIQCDVPSSGGQLGLHRELFSVTHKSHYDLDYLSDEEYTTHLCHRKVFIAPGRDIFGPEWSSQSWNASHIEQMITDVSEQDGYTARERAEYYTGSKDTNTGVMSIVYMYRRKNENTSKSVGTNIARLRALAHSAGCQL